MAQFPKLKPMYEAFQKFLQKCILDNYSLLWPGEEIWTPENVAEVKRRMVDAPLLGGDLSFEEKLQEQMQGASSQHWMIVCDVYYVYFLPSSYITLGRRFQYIRRAAQQAGRTLPPESDPVWEAQEGGFVRTSLKYHYKYAQFWLILLFANQMKSMENPQAVVESPQKMQQVLDELLEGIPERNDRAYDMRHAMLYMAFPDEYERSISTRDKERIVKTYGDRIEGPVPADLDEAIRKIRAVLSSEHDLPERPFDFYNELGGEWKPKSKPPVDNGGGDTPPVQENEEVFAVLPVLKQTRNIVLYGPPGTGKTYIAKKVAEKLVGAQTQQSLSESEFIMWSTFHQSYAYEDFVEGLRPVPSEEGSGEISYQVVPGIFRRICVRAAEDPDNKYVLVIDEINRGNVAKILGELITLLEDDKRAGAGNALSVTLPYSGETFSVPGNLYIIGTMNTADRSIALLDVALRRRFAFVELMPRPELLDKVQVESPESSVSLGNLLRGLNQGIRQYIDRDHQVGHSYFLKVAQADEEDRMEVLEFVWNHQVMPLLEEYFYSQRDKLAELLAPFRTDVEAGVEPDLQDGFDVEIGWQEGDDLVVALAKIAQKGAS